MTTFLDQLYQYGYQLYFNFFYKDKDTRLDGFWLMDSVIPTALASFTYLIVCKVIGPKLMEKRKPFHLKKVIFWYNIFQVLVSTYIFYEVFDIEWFTTWKILKCQPVDYSDNPRSLRNLRAFYLYYLVKFIEYLDTVFFVLRKKNNQISFLHLYHHASMPCYTWYIVKSFGGGSWILVPLENGFVHMVMYTYYLLAGLGPKWQKYLWWKKYITRIQMLQFAVGIVHFIFILFETDPKCNLQKRFIITGLVVGTLFYFLFRQFYIQAYVKPEEVTKSSTNDCNQNGIKVQISNGELIKTKVN